MGCGMYGSLESLGGTGGPFTFKSLESPVRHDGCLECLGCILGGPDCCSRADWAGTLAVGDLRGPSSFVYRGSGSLFSKTAPF